MMKRLLKHLAKWGPAVAIAGIFVIAGLRYQESLIGWFAPLIQPFVQGYIDSNPEGYASKAMQGSMSKGEMPESNGLSAERIDIGPFSVAVQWETTPSIGQNALTLSVLDESGVALSGASVSLKAGEIDYLSEVSPGIYQGNISLSEEGSVQIKGEVRTVDMRHGEFVLVLTTGKPGVSIVSASAGSTGAEQGDISHWTCSMHPSVHLDGPGTCPICAMDVVPVTQEEVETGVIVVDARRRQLIGVKTGLVRRESMTKTIRTIGTVVPAETRLTDVTLKVKAWIGKVTADFTGIFVREGETLFSFYSPEIWSAQEEYLESIRRAQESPTRTNRLVEAAEARLRLWGIGASEIDAIRKQNRPSEYLRYASPATGTVMKKTIVEGSAVEAGELLYRIADLSTLWVEADIYENELPLVEVGQTAEISLSYQPQRAFEGTVSYIYPYLNPKTRTARIRIEVPNPDGSLKPAMYTNVSIRVALGERLVVPESAVIYAGKSRVAFVDLGEGRLEPRKIQTGIRTDGLIEVLEGLREGEIVVTSANFLIAAESKLKSGMDKW